MSTRLSLAPTARVRDLFGSIRTWIANRNEDPRPYVWHKTAGEAFVSLASYRRRISDSGD